MTANTCARCGHPIRKVWDDHGFAITLATTPLTVTGECHAVIDGRLTFDVIPASRRNPGEVWRRTRDTIGKPAKGALYAAHRCAAPIPPEWAAPPPDHVQITHQPDPDAEPLF